jgi:hypothetical protein
VGSLRRRAWALKLSTSLPLLVGTVVHNAARQVVAAVRDEQPVPDAGELYDGARFTLNHVWLTSVRHPERFWAAPAIHPMLREVLARGGLEESELLESKDRLERCLGHLTSAPILEDLRRCRPGEVLLSDSVAESFVVTAEPGEVAPEDTQGGGTQEVVVALDVAYRHHDRESADGLLEYPTWVVADWKTGRTVDEDARLQLGTYALFLRSRGRPLVDGGYLGRLVNLAAGAEWLEIIGEHELRWALTVIEADVQRLRALHAAPLPPADTAPSPEAFPYAAKPSFACPSCAFLTLCTEELGRRPWQRPAVAGVAGQESPPAASGPTAAVSEEAL